MRLSQHFGQTLRQAPAEADLISHQLLVRGGFIRQLSSGIYSFLPLGWRVAQRIEQIMREEMTAIQCEELEMPVVQPAGLWQETGRWYALGSELVRFKDRGERDMVLAMTHEEVATDLVRHDVKSYRQLPIQFFHIQTKFRDEPRPRGGLIRVREFRMKDAYSFHTDWEDQDRFYREIAQAYFNIFRRCGLDVLMVESDTGMMGGRGAHEFQYVTDAGEDTIFCCGNCDYSANRDIARMEKGAASDEALAEIEKVATPECKTIEQVASFLGVPRGKTLKAVFYHSEGKPIIVVVRGDLEVNEMKLGAALKAPDLRLATDDELKAAGLVAGYASPVGVKGIKIVADESVPLSRNLVGGANDAGYHIRNVNYGRDFTTDVVADIAAAEEGGICPRCHAGKLTIKRGIEVGNIFKLGTKYSASMSANFLDAEGQEHPIIMGSYGIGVGRLLAAVVEQNHDDKGILWPRNLAPYQVHLVALAGTDATVTRTADDVYAELCQAGYDVLYDDRDESAGVKFNDADLLGLPVRLTVSGRSLSKGGVEMKLRSVKAFDIVPREDLMGEVSQALRAPEAGE